MLKASAASEIAHRNISKQMISECCLFAIVRSHKKSHTRRSEEISGLLYERKSSFPTAAQVCCWFIGNIFKWCQSYCIHRSLDTRIECLQRLLFFYYCLILFVLFLFFFIIDDSVRFSLYHRHTPTEFSFVSVIDRLIVDSQMIHIPLCVCCDVTLCIISIFRH